MSLFRIEVLDTGGARQAMLTNVISVSRTRSLDKIGQVAIDLPATDPATAVVGAGRQYAIYHASLGYLGTYTHSGQDVGVTGAPSLRITGSDGLLELARKNCYFRRTFNNVAVETVIGTLLGLPSGWTSGAVESGIGNATVSIEGESVLEAITELGNAWGRHWRLGTVSRSLDFGAFGTASGIRLIKADSLPPEIEGNTTAALVTDLSVSVESEAVVNRLIPLGAGAGTTQLSLEHVTSYDAGYPVQTGTNADGSSFYYIEDTTSQTAYGLIERPFVRSEIRPLSNSLTSLQNAANALYQAALATLLKLRNPVTQYDVTVTNLNPASVLPGDTVRLFWRGIVTREGVAYKWLDVNSDLYVLDISEDLGSDGAQRVSLTVATSADRRAQDEDIIAGLVRSVGVTKTHVQTNLTKDRVGPYVLGIDSTHNAKFSFEIGDETQALNYAFLRFKTGHLNGNVGVVSGSSTSSGNSEVEEPGASSEVTTGTGDTHYHSVIIREDSNASSHTPVYLDVSEDGADRLRAYIGSDVGVDTSGEGGHTHNINHTHNIDHTHTFTPELSTSYGFYEDTDYPDHITVWIDGSNETLALYGAATLDNTGTGISGQTIEITQYLEDQSSLRAIHTVEFRCTGGQGEIEAELVMLMTVQAIAVT